MNWNGRGRLQPIDLNSHQPQNLQEQTTTQQINSLHSLITSSEYWKILAYCNQGESFWYLGCIKVLCWTVNAINSKPLASDTHNIFTSVMLYTEMKCFNISMD